MSKISDDVAKEIGLLTVKAMNDPETRGTMAKALKKHAPNLRTTDVDIADVRQEFRAELSARDDEAERRKIVNGLARKRAKIADEYGAGNIGEIEQVMTKYGLSDYDAGAKLWSADKEPAPGTHEPMTGQSWDLGIDFNKALADPFKYGRPAAYAEIDRLRGRRSQ